MIKIRQREENGSKRNGFENDILDNRNRYQEDLETLYNNTL